MSPCKRSVYKNKILKTKSFSKEVDTHGFLGDENEIEQEKNQDRWNQRKESKTYKEREKTICKGSGIGESESE